MAGAPPRRSDLDFADVFGGPPRRSSGNEHRSRRGSMDGSSFGSSAPRPRSRGSDTHVFGDRGSSDRRRQLGEEFYKDIFPGNEEAASPRRGGVEWGDVFGSASPGSTARPRSRKGRANEVQERMKKTVLTDNIKMETKMDTISGRNGAASDESIQDTKDKADSMVDHDDIHIEDLDDCVVEHVSEDPVLHDGQEKEQMKISESKIREWSRGKEGNIRSLLSTLQYVLWPESGWKPVPLVDIIEGAAVKKAYQKALLCLHPDKLQQRGAAMHQKFIAEKVFDILQESWKEFNSVSFG
nr:unnamed protein product [Digitaria exilis]